MYIYMYEYIGYNQIDLLEEPLSCCERTSPTTVWRQGVYPGVSIKITFNKQGWYNIIPQRMLDFFFFVFIPACDDDPHGL